MSLRHTDAKNDLHLMHIMARGHCIQVSPSFPVLYLDTKTEHLAHHLIGCHIPLLAQCQRRTCEVCEDIFLPNCYKH